MNDQRFDKEITKIHLHSHEMQKSITNGVLVPEIIRNINKKVRTRIFSSKLYFVSFQFFHNFVTSKKHISTFFLHKIEYFLVKCQITVITLKNYSKKKRFCYLLRF